VKYPFGKVWSFRHGAPLVFSNFAALEFAASFDLALRFHYFLLIFTETSFPRWRARFSFAFSPVPLENLELSERMGIILSILILLRCSFFLRHSLALCLQCSVLGRCLS